MINCFVVHCTIVESTTVFHVSFSGVALMSAIIALKGNCSIPMFQYFAAGTCLPNSSSSRVFWGNSIGRRPLIASSNGLEGMLGQKAVCGMQLCASHCVACMLMLAKPALSGLSFTFAVWTGRQ